MAYPVYQVPAGDVLPIFFDTFAGSTGASITLSGLAVTDIEIYRDGGTTQRASDAGYTLLDTDGIDFDGITGIHGFSIDIGDNTDAGFYVTGAWYHVVVSAVTVDSQTVNFIAAAFRIMAAEDAAGVPDANVTHFGGTAGTFAGGRPEVNTSHIAGSAVSTTTAQIGCNAVQVSGDSTAADNLEQAYDDAAGTVPWHGIIDQGTAQSATGTTVVLRAAAAFADSTLVGAVIGVLGSTQGYWQYRAITANTLADDTVTVDTWTVTPSGTITYKIFGSAPASTSSPMPVNVTQISGDATAADNAEAFFDGTGYAGTNNVIPTVTTVSGLANNAITAAAIATGAIDADAIADGAIDAGAIAADAITAAKIATGAIDADALATDAVNEIADGILNRNMATGTDSGTATVRTPRQALRALRNRVAVAAGTATVYAEDDSTTSWTAAVTTTAGNPISEVDPASA